MSDNWISDPLTTLEHARKHCVEIMPLHTQKQARAYLFAMEEFERAFWEYVREKQARD